MSRPEKISAAHLERLAVVYVRQSTVAQVRRHTESTQRQYALAVEAERLGWPAARVEVIDDDLGVSGRSAAGRSGFRELVGRVCVGEVGAILGLEVSRLARSSADLQRLLELARLTDTLVIDADGIYDLADFNDRLLDDLARWLNPIVSGWINYYGRFYRTALDPLLQRVNAYLRRWAGRKYKRLRTNQRYGRWLAGLLSRQPGLFTHWRLVRTY